MPQNMLRQVKLVVNKLKLEFGLPMHIWHPISNDHNIETGKIVRQFQMIYIRRGVLLPKNLTRSFEYDLTYLNSGTNFVYGALFDVAQRNILVDVSDLPKGFEVTNEDMVIFNAKRWEVLKTALSEDNKAVYIAVKELASYDTMSGNYTVAGGISHRINGIYFENGLNTYCLHNGRYWLWFSSSLNSWIISVVVNELGTFHWRKGDSTITGSYAPQGLALGTVTVASV